MEVVEHIQGQKAGVRDPRDENKESQDNHLEVFQWIDSGFLKVTQELWVLS